MKPVLLLQRVLCTLAMLAVLIGPAAVAAAAAAMAASGSMPGMMMDMDEQAQATSDMGCCLELDRPAVPDCTKSCPLALVCSSVIVATVSAVDGLLVMHSLPRSFLMLQETNLVSTLLEPPPRPPRA